jgi:NRPS condensation-like uncharacterized protein
MESRNIIANFNESMFDEFDGKVGSNTMYLVTDMKDLDMKAFRESIKAAIKDVPLMASIINKGYWRDTWKPIENYDIDRFIKTYEVEENPFYEKAYSQFLRLTNKRIDMGKEPPFKVKVFYNKSNSKKVVVFCIHHALVDGRGCFRLVRLIGEHYNAIMNNQILKPRKNYRAVSILINSLNIIHVAKALLSSFVGLFLDPINKASMKPLLPREEDIDINSSSETIERIVIKNADLYNLRAYYKAYDYTLNDILMLLTFKLMVKYNMALEKPSKSVGIALGVDLRRYFKKDYLSVSNYSVMDSFTVKTEHVNDLSKMEREFKRLKEKPIGLGVIVEPVFTSVFPIAKQRKMLNKWARKFIMEGSIRAIQTTNVGITDEHMLPFGDIVENISFIGCSPMCGFPQISIARYKDILTLHFIKYNDNNGLAQKVKNDYQELLNEIIAS